MLVTLEIFFNDITQQILNTTQYVYSLAKTTDNPRGQDIATEIIMTYI
jgi:hypothetical protein